jgi:hypothetical protein
MRVVANSSAISKPKPLAGKTQLPVGAGRDRQVTTIKPRRLAPTSLRSRPLPLWFLRLNLWQRRTSIVTLLLIAGTVITYSSTVYLQQQWSQQFRKLENLQRRERELTATNEVLKNQLASEAEQPSTELVSPNPADAIILKAFNPASNPALIKPEAQPKIDIPSGY